MTLLAVAQTSSGGASAATSLNMLSIAAKRAVPLNSSARRVVFRLALVMAGSRSAGMRQSPRRPPEAEQGLHRVCIRRVAGALRLRQH